MRRKRHSLTDEHQSVLRGPVDRSKVRDHRPVFDEVHFLLQSSAQQEQTTFVQVAKENGILKGLSEPFHADIDVVKPLPVADIIGDQYEIAHPHLVQKGS
jgi:hypothetical protein